MSEDPNSLPLPSRPDPNAEMVGHILNLNNQIFLSEHQLNCLYALLLINRPSLWDQVLPSDPQMKHHVDQLLKHKISDVEVVLAQLLKIYEDKIKASNLNWLEKFMTIIKARNKNIYIQRVACEHERDGSKEQGGFDNELLGIFYGISNISMFVGTGMGKFIQYNDSERYITMKMGHKYNLTIKNQDPVYLDTKSKLSVLPKQLFTHHIFQYINAYDLFSIRGVCKQWNQYVREAWHSIFKRQMLMQLMASELCKQLQFHFKMFQLRNPFYQKLNPLLHALIEIIQWQNVTTSIQSNTVSMPLKRVLILLLKLIGEDIPIHHFNDITQLLWEQYKPMALQIKQRVVTFFSNLSNTVMSIQQLKAVKRSFLDHPFMRVQQMGSEDKTPLLLSIFIKQLALQSILKNHLILTQEYLLNAKKRLDEISKERPQNKGFLEIAYKILLLRNGRERMEEEKEGEDINDIPDYSSLLKSIFEEQEQEFQKPDFVLRGKGKNSVTNVFMCKRTKLDIIVSTYRKAMEPMATNGAEEMRPDQQNEHPQHRQLQHPQHPQIPTQQSPSTHTQTPTNNIETQSSQKPEPPPT